MRVTPLIGVFQQPVRLAFEFYKGSQVLLCMLQDLYVTSARVKNIPLFVSGFPCGLHYFYFLLSIGYSREKARTPRSEERGGMAAWFRTALDFKSYWLFLWKKPRAEARGSSHWVRSYHRGWVRKTPQKRKLGLCHDRNRWG